MQQLHPVINRLFKKKGLTENDISQFLSWDLKSIPDLNALKDIDNASARIILAIHNNEKIGVYGDYDVDGTTSCALFYHFFKLFNLEVDLIQPSRFIEGYGLHVSSIEEAKQKNIKVLITVDCGITSHAAALAAIENNIDLIITDHHKDSSNEMPKAFAVVNPNRRDENHYQLKYMAGVAVAFALCLQIKQDLQKNGKEIPSIYNLLQFVAIGTICDLAELNIMNLRLVRHGLKQIKTTEFPGLRAFFTADELNAKTISSEKLAFHVGPLINSKGRLDHPEIALKLLVAKSSDDARGLYEQLVQCNQERKFIQSEVFKEAEKIVISEIKNKSSNTPHLISIVYRPHWHEGVIGIVASKLVETFKVPAIVFTNSEHSGIIKASCRSAGELDLFSLLKKEESLFIKFGGHKAAAGLSMPVENLQILIRNLNNNLKILPEIERTEMDHYDLEIESNEISPKLMHDLDLLEPFGMGNEKPIFRIKNINLDSFDILKDAHVKWNFSKDKVKMRGISFNYIGKFNATAPTELYNKQKIHHDNLSIYFTLSINRFNGNESIQLFVSRLETGDL